MKFFILTSVNLWKFKCTNLGYGKYFRSLCEGWSMYRGGYKVLVLRQWVEITASGTHSRPALRHGATRCAEYRRDATGRWTPASHRSDLPQASCESALLKQRTQHANQVFIKYFIHRYPRIILQISLIVPRNSSKILILLLFFN